MLNEIRARQERRLWGDLHEPYWSDAALERAVRAGTVVVGKLYMRPGQAWAATLEGPYGRVHVEGARALNRCMHGDTVAVLLLGLYGQAMPDWPVTELPTLNTEDVSAEV